MQNLNNVIDAMRQSVKSMKLLDSPMTHLEFHCGYSFLTANDSKRANRLLIQINAHLHNAYVVLCETSTYVEKLTSDDAQLVINDVRLLVREYTLAKSTYEVYLERANTASEQLRNIAIKEISYA